MKRIMDRLRWTGMDGDASVKLAAFGASLGAVISYADGGVVSDAALLGGGIGFLAQVGVYLAVVLGLMDG